MEHVVFSAAEGGAGEEFRRVSTLEEAVRLVEHLRNDLGVMYPSVYALTPVPLSFRAYYRVEVPGLDSPAEELPLAELPTIVGAPLGEPAFAARSAESVEVAFEPNADLAVPAVLPETSVIPPSRQYVDGEPSLGYFAR